MKIILGALCAIVFAVVLAAGNPTNLLGAKECTWGPSYWCSNLTNAKNCKAVRHCIQTVWEQQTVPEDNDSICQICLDMVKQARDQLESNETQSDLRMVFEGSCQLIPIKPVQKECIKLVDNFIPELVEALASQMNPQMVCSVAGLCNNAAIDVMLEEYNKKKVEQPKEGFKYKAETVPKKQLTCLGCNHIATILTDNFKSTDRDVILENMLHMCGRLSSFSDACSNTVLSYFNDIYDKLKEDLSADGICHMSGVCSGKFHQHPELVEIRPMSNVGVVTVNDDIPCELCEQLIRHLRDLLVANTTEAEFKQVLEGLCKQTQGFKSECLSIVDQYYDEIYKTLVGNLDENGACFMIGVCPKGSEFLNFENQGIMPLLPVLAPADIKVSIKEHPKKKLLGSHEPHFTNEQLQSMQLPIDRLMGAPQSHLLVQNGELCTLCEYFLHFVQESLATPKTEEKIKEAVEAVCMKTPNSIRGKCHDFVDMYGDAVIALLIQGIDPSQVCPKLVMCPKNVADMEVFAPQPIDVAINSKPDQSDKPTCPLCLFAMQQAQEMIKSDKTKSNIKHALDNLCSHLPAKLKAECVDFIETYSNELVSMLITDFTPQQICVSIKLCPQTKPDLSEWNISTEENTDDIMTNEIADNTINGQPIYSIDSENVSTPQCILCKTVIQEAEKRISNKKSKEQIKDALEHACDKIHKMQKECHKYIDKYGDKIANLIIMEMSPKQICRELGYCSVKDQEDLEIDEAVKIELIAVPNAKSYLEALANDDLILPNLPKDAPPCVLCEFVMTKLEEELKDKKNQDDIKHTVENICKKMPGTISGKCNKFVELYGNLIISMVDTVPPKQMCQKLSLCTALETETTDEVIECGICHGTTMALYDFVKERNGKIIDPQDMIEVACETLPGKYYEKCSELIEYYGHSIAHLIRYDSNLDKICSKIGKCFENEAGIGAFVRLTALDRNRRSEEKELVGSNPCTYGPAHWCSKKENAENCGTTKFCEEKGWNNDDEKY